MSSSFRQEDAFKWPDFRHIKIATYRLFMLNYLQSGLIDLEYNFTSEYDQVMSQLIEVIYQTHGTARKRHRIQTATRLHEQPPLLQQDKCKTNNGTKSRTNHKTSTNNGNNNNQWISNNIITIITRAAAMTTGVLDIVLVKYASYILLLFKHINTCCLAHLKTS